MTKVLLVDDERDFLDLVSGFLTEVDVSHVETVGAAISSVRREPPDVVLLDLNLEEEDGLDLLPQMTSDSELGQIPVVAFSVHDGRFEEARRQGAAGFLRKPFRGYELRETVRPFLGEPTAIRGSE